jgi:hypothetical protein
MHARERRRFAVGKGKTESMVGATVLGWGATVSVDGKFFGKSSVGR